MKEDFVKKEGGNPFGGNGLFGGAENHPLTKAMVDHDQQRIKTVGRWKVSDEVARNLLEGVRGRRFDRG